MYNWKYMEKKLHLERYMQLRNDCGPSVFKERDWVGLTFADLRLWMFLKNNQLSRVDFA